MKPPIFSSRCLAWTLVMAILGTYMPAPTQEVASTAAPHTIFETEALALQAQSTRLPISSEGQGAGRDRGQGKSNIKLRRVIVINSSELEHRYAAGSLFQIPIPWWSRWRNWRITKWVGARV